MIQGIDISHLQTINWAKLSPNIKFVWAKATQGATFTDPDFNDTWQYLKTTNLYRGGYIFWDCKYTAQQHWDNFVKLGIDFSKPYVMPLMIDIENQATKELDAIVAKNHAHYADQISQLIELAKAGTCRNVVLYSDPSYFKDYLGGASWPDCYLWLAAIQANPPHPIGKWTNWTFWQNSWTGKIDGTLTGGALDMDLFNGDLSQLAKL